MSHWFQPLPPKVSGPARDHPNRRWRPLYLDHATCAMTHVSGTSRHVNRPANVSHARSSAPAMTHIGWDRTAIGHRSAELCDMGGGSVINLLDGAEDQRRGALDRPAHQVPWAVAVMYLGESPLDRHDLAVRAGGHVTASQNAGQHVRRRIELGTQDIGESAFVGFDDRAGVVCDQSA